MLRLALDCSFVLEDVGLSTSSRRILIDGLVPRDCLHVWPEVSCPSCDDVDLLYLPKPDKLSPFNDKFNKCFEVFLPVYPYKFFRLENFFNGQFLRGCVGLS